MTDTLTRGWIGLVVPVLLLTACAQAPVLTDRPPVEERGSQDAYPHAYQRPVTPPMTSSRPPLPATPASGSPAVVALMSRAATEQQAGALDRSAATLERALRIEPQNARLWTALARVRLAQQRWQQVEQLALKSNQLASGDQTLQYDNWRLIAAARRGGGDIPAARVAEARAAAVKP